MQYGIEIRLERFWFYCALERDSAAWTARNPRELVSARLFTQWAATDIHPRREAR